MSRLLLVAGLLLAFVGPLSAQEKKDPPKDPAKPDTGKTEPATTEPAKTETTAKARQTWFILPRCKAT